MEAITQAAFTAKDMLEGLFLLEPWKAPIQLIISFTLTPYPSFLKGRLSGISFRDKPVSLPLALKYLVVNYYIQFEVQ